MEDEPLEQRIVLDFIIGKFRKNWINRNKKRFLRGFKS